MEEIFQNLKQRNWETEFADTGQENWQEKWSLDGERATVKNTPKGIVFSAGPVKYDDGSHAVLWTKDSFSGDIKIEFDFTRLDSINRDVNILYIQASGTGKGPYAENIMEWSDLREVPYLKSYFETMNLLHVSYAAFKDSDDEPDDYVRARRYPPQPGNNFWQTDISPDNFDTGLFLPGVTYHFTFIKTAEDLFFEAKNADVRKLFHWSLENVKPVEKGWVGIRHMYLRCSRYANVDISTLNPNA